MEATLLFKIFSFPATVLLCAYFDIISLNLSLEYLSYGGNAEGRSSGRALRLRCVHCNCGATPCKTKPTITESTTNSWIKSHYATHNCTRSYGAPILEMT